LAQLSTVSRTALPLASSHFLQQPGTDMLKGNIEVFTDFIAFADQLEQRLVQKVWVSV
jgi:hypothetical protein